MKNFLVLLSLLFITHIPMSCDRSSNNRSYDYHVKSFAAQVGNQMDQYYDSFREIDFSKDSIQDSAFRIALTIEDYNAIERLSAISNPFITSTYADPEPEPEEPLLNTKIELISIYPLDSFFTGDGNYDSTKSISNLFGIQYNYLEPMSLTKFTEELREWRISSPLLLNLNEAIAINYKGSFKIKITMSDGYIMEAETKPTYILKH